MHARRLRGRPGFVVCGLVAAAAGFVLAAGPAVGLPGAVSEAVNTAFPGAAISGAEVETDEGVTLYVVRLEHEGSTLEAEVSPGGVIAEVETVLSLDDVPGYVAAAIARVTGGVVPTLIERHEQRAEVEDGHLVPLRKPAVFYQVEFTVDGLGHEVEIADTPALRLPQPALQAVEAAFPGATIREVETEHEMGLTLYEAELEQGGREFEVEVSPEGTIVSVEQEVASGELPAAVAEAIAGAAGGAAVTELEKEEVHAVPRLVRLDEPTVVYEAEFAKDGRTHEVEVGADGRIIGLEAEDGEDQDDDDETPDAPASRLPEPALQALEAAFPGAVIGSVGTEYEMGLALYEAELEQDGREFEVEVSPEGTIVSVEHEVASEELPAAVAEAIAGAAGGAPVTGLEKEEVHAVPRLVRLDAPTVVYEAEFVKDGRTHEVEVGADGKVVEVQTEDEGDRDDDE